MKILIITQARSGSTRLPNKILKKILGKTLLEIHIDRIKQNTTTQHIMVATTTSESDVVIEDEAKRMRVLHSRGSEDNVLDRFYQAAKPHQPKWVVRLTSDCPLVDPEIIDKVISHAIENDVDYCSNTLNPTFPDGIDIEVFKFSALEKAWNEADLLSEKEHVTPYIHKNSTFNNKDLFTSINYENSQDYSHVRLTVDEPNDFEVIKLIIEKIGQNKSWKEYADYYLSNEKIKTINSQFKRNEGYEKSISNDN